MAEPLRSQSLRQASFPGMCPVEDALEQLAAAGIEERGAVFTRREVVDFILDLVGYTADRKLHEQRLLEPSFGHGDFLIAAIERLVAAWKSHAPEVSALTLTSCIHAVELHHSSFNETRQRVIACLLEHGIALAEARELAAAWLARGDFLLAAFAEKYHYVVGNPPYVRQELIPDALIAEYRARYSTVFDRADIYIPFIERSLTALEEGGALGFICADRWMKNRYGGPLRQMVADRFHLKIYVDMYDTPAFHSDVIAYPAITVITREKPGRTRIAHRPEIGSATLKSLARDLLGADIPDPVGPVKEMAGVAAGAEPWILDSSDQLALVRRLERDFPLIEEAGCRVGIGVATGADNAFIGPFDELDVEDDRKLPLATTRDILTGSVRWRGLGIVNPFADAGGLVDLRKFPRLRRYLEARKDQIAKRHIAQKAPANWYRTIDRIYPELTSQPKLLIPDIKGEAHIVYEGGKLYPHHNLYFITSEEWDLHALQAVLMSGIARLFVATYSTRMRGGYLRFQAQYLRRIRLPRWNDVSSTLKRALISAAKSGDVAACNRAVFELYGLSTEERSALGGNGN
ncbi:Eco57I restriction-modification methylase domain-containing protein [Inquilinus sp. Marseille-Q2685]|uniref:Eco57I restriction-modification methylase domain-containing protein n=1 Tax=Inquilinus sp. Marseille-Q2685 TaxID=2866581 RepID=UPI001CE40F1D|nr:N-6 DNA methylase [Inquilinus sp. Marseille-Q2685]